MDQGKRRGELADRLVEGGECLQALEDVGGNGDVTGAEERPHLRAHRRGEPL